MDGKGSGDLYPPLSPECATRVAGPGGEGGGTHWVFFLLTVLCGIVYTAFADSVL